MLTRFPRAVVAVALLLASCAMSEPTQRQYRPHGRADVLLATDRGMGAVVLDGDRSYLALANSALRPSAVLHTDGPINARALWQVLDIGYCALGAAREGDPLRQPALVRLAGALYLHQATLAMGEHALCRLGPGQSVMAPHDANLTVCREQTCARLWMTQLQWHGKALLSNAGGGDNVLALSPGAALWRSLVGRLGAQPCPHAAFGVSGNRLLAGGHCAPGDSSLRAWELPKGPARPLAVKVNAPALEQRTVHFIAPAHGAAVFAGLTGGLLKSTDGGRSFRFVIHHAHGTLPMPELRHLLVLRDHGRVLLVAGAQAAGPYLAVSADGGERWTDLSAILPAGPGGQASVTSLAQDRQGRILATLNLQPRSQGRLLLLTLGGLD